MADPQPAPSLPTRILAPAGILGYSLVEDDFFQCLEGGVDAIVVDAGSTDPGPYMLGLGSTLVTEESYLRDLRPMIKAVHERKIPLFIGSAGGAGTNAQVDWTVDVIGRLAAEAGHQLRIAKIYADIPTSVMHDALTDGRVKANVRGDLPTAADVDSTENLVAQMGAEPFTRILEGEPVDVIVAGRAYDPAPLAAWAMQRGVEPGIAWHMGKILECGGACAEPKGGGVMATVYADAFEVTPMSERQVCTPLSVAAHTLYEKSRPDLLPGPDGVLDVTGCTYTPVDDRTARVTGSVLQPADGLTLKMEGASIVGERAVFIGGVRDPILIGQIDEFLERIAKTAEFLHPELVSGEARLDFKVYGQNAVMGALEPSALVPHEVGVLGEVTAPTKELAKTICTTARVGVLHLSYEGQMATAGNLALPLNPIDVPIGPVCAFTVYHVIDAAGLDLFPISYETVGAP